jgi:Nineteen complex-related protein 2
MYVSSRTNKGEPTYDANYLSELKASTPSTRPPQPVTQTYEMSYDADAVAVNNFSNGDIPLDSSFGKSHAGHSVLFINK